MRYTLSQTEQDIMTLLWQKKQWLSAADFWVYFNNNGKECKRQTIHTYLVRMEEKGFLVKNKKKYMYAFTEDEFAQKKAKDVLDTMFNGSLKQLIVALAGNKNISSEEANKLKDYLNDLD